MKLIKSIRVGRMVVPAGTTLNFSNEGYMRYKGINIHKSCVPEVAIESEEEIIDALSVEGDGSEIAEAVVAMLRNKYPDGFTEDQFIEDFGDKLDGNQYSIMTVDDEDVLMLKTSDDEAIEIYLSKVEDDKFVLTGEYHVASNTGQSAALESMLGRIATVAMRSRHCYKRM